jgi:hypothetical protein
MILKLKNLLERAETWPETDQEELAELAAEIESRHSGVYVLSDREWADLQEGIAQADRSEFVPDEVIAEENKRYGI